MKHGPSNHHPRCTCHKCQPPVSRTPAQPPPRDPTLFGERRPSTPAARPPAPVAPAAATPPPPVQYLPDVDDRDGAVRITAATARRYAAASTAAGRDPRAARLLALRRQGIARDEAMRIVDTEFTATTTERERP